MAWPRLKLTEEQTKNIFDEIDRDKSGSIDKKEMEQFIITVMKVQRDLTFKKSDVIVTMLGNSIHKTMEEKVQIMKKQVQEMKRAIEANMRQKVENKLS